MHHIGGTIKHRSKTLPETGKHYSSVPKFHMDEHTYTNGHTTGIPSYEEPPETQQPYSQPSASYTPPPISSMISTNIDTEALMANLRAMKDQIDTMMKLVQAAPGQGPAHTPAKLPHMPVPTAAPQDSINQVEGVFNGEGMIGSDGKTYPISANYASKSKLIEGDILKLSIDTFGRFIYKQVGPTQRKHVRGRIVFDESSQKWSALTEGRMYRLLTAAVSYHKGEHGDEIILIVPENGESMWGAVEMILKG